MLMGVFEGRKYGVVLSLGNLVFLEFLGGKIEIFLFYEENLDFYCLCDENVEKFEFFLCGDRELYKIEMFFLK
jgi:hypothetical protein